MINLFAVISMLVIWLAFVAVVWFIERSIAEIRRGEDRDKPFSRSYDD